MLTTSAFGGASEEGILRAWEPLATYRWLFNREARAGAPSTARTRPGLLRRIGRRCLVPDVQITWLPSALWQALRTLGDGKCDLIYTSFPPASAHLLGLLLKEYTDLPWVADFRDSWICDPLDPELVANPRRSAFEARLEEAVIRAADAVVVATTAVAAHLRRTYPEAAPRIEVVTNGFEPADFTRTAPPPPGGALRIAHTGSFSLSHPQRTPRPLFAALEALLAADADWSRRLHLELVGALSPEEERAAQALVAAGVVHLAGSQERSAALACQQRAHVLLLVDHPRPWPATNVPGKLYEYMAAERPVLALAGTGMVERLVRELDLGIFVPADDPAAIGAALELLHDRFQRGALAARVEPRVLRRYHRRELTRELARIFDGLVAA